MNDLSEARGIGDNKPPVSLVDTLAEKYKKELDQAAELKDAAESAPIKIDDDETEAKVSELILNIRGLERVFDDAQKEERKPFADTVKVINGYFLTKIEPLTALRDKLKARSGEYLERKAAAAKRALEEEAEKKREQAKRDLEAAQKAEAERIAAENARKEAQRKADEAEAAKVKAEQDRKDAEARREAALEAEKKLARERKEREAQAAKDAEAQAAQKLIDDAAAAKAKADREQAEKEAAEAKAKRDAAREEQRKAEDAAAQAKRDERLATRDGKEALDNAVRSEKHADKMESKAEGPDADLARTRSEHGAVSTMSRNWVCRVTDYDKLDKNALWGLIHRDAIDVAVRKWMLLQPTTQEARQMPGTVMEIEVTAQHR
jgi:hypothetical protein